MRSFVRDAWNCANVRVEFAIEHPLQTWKFAGRQGTLRRTSLSQSTRRAMAVRCGENIVTDKFKQATNFEVGSLNAID
jgi:hypothetical protein